jgi:hypothetical protein
MSETDRDTHVRLAAFNHVRRLVEVHDPLTSKELKPGFAFEGQRIPLINPQRGIFKPRQMRFLLSIKVVFSRPGGRVWYDTAIRLGSIGFSMRPRSSSRAWRVTIGHRDILTINRLTAATVPQPSPSGRDDATVAL